MLTSPTLDNTNPSEKVLFSTKKRTNTSVSNQAATKLYSLTKARKRTAKATLNTSTAVVSGIAKTVLCDSNVAAK
jgi:hypothetical protein